MGKGSMITRRGFLVALGAVLTGCAAQGPDSTRGGTTKVTDSVEAAPALFAYRFADVEEGRGLLLSSVEYHQRFTQGDLDFRLQRKDGTLEEYLAFAAGEVREFNEEEKEALDWGMRRVAELVAARGVTLPACDEIVFVKTTMAEECDAAAYTHGTQIYFGESVMPSFLDHEDWAIELLAHELFHCLTRSNPDFRARMYRILGFEVREEDYEFGDEVAARVISNPDVEHHNSSALFTIEGKKVPCAVVFYAKVPFERKGDSIFDLGGTGLVPTDGLDRIYDKDEVPDFFDVFGRNTDYVIDPEETMADNFSFAVAYGRDGREYQTPELIEAILAELAQA